MADFLSGLAGLLGNLFTDQSSPYRAAQDAYQQYGQQAMNAQQPYLQAGQQGLGNYQDWLKGMQDPTKFINNTMSQYQQSPMAKYLQNQSIRSGQAAASASGLSGSTPFSQQLAQDANNISSQDMGSWMNNVLGVNTQYGQGQQSLANMGQHSADNMSDMYEKMAEQMASTGAGQAAGHNQNTANIFASIQQMLSGLNPMSMGNNSNPQANNQGQWAPMQGPYSGQGSAAGSDGMNALAQLFGGGAGGGGASGLAPMFMALMGGM